MTSRFDPTVRHLTRTEFRHASDDKQRWIAAADACGLSLSEYIRAALDHKTSGTPFPVPRTTTPFARMDPVALAQLTGACNNLNQVVHFGHSVGAMDTDQIEELAEEIITLVRADIARRNRG